MEFAEVTYDVKGSTFRIFLDPDVSDSSAQVAVIVYMRIPAQGYPVQVGTYNKSGGIFTPNNKDLANKSEVEEYFADQLQDPDSKLIQAVGFALRRRNKY